MRIPAKFSGKCAKCGDAINRGDEIEYADKKAFHHGCYSEEEPFDRDGADELADRLGFQPKV